MAIPYDARLIACARCNTQHPEGAACADARGRSDSRRPLSAFAVSPAPGSATRSHVQPTEARSELANDRWDDTPAAPPATASGAPPAATSGAPTSLSRPAAPVPAMPSFETSDSDPGTLMYGRAADGSIRVRNAPASDAPALVHAPPATLARTLGIAAPTPVEQPPVPAPPPALAPAMTTEAATRRLTPRGTLHFGPGTFSATPSPAAAPVANVIVAAPVPVTLQGVSQTVPSDERVTMSETLAFHRNADGGFAPLAPPPAPAPVPAPTAAPAVAPVSVPTPPAARATDTTPFGATLSYAPLDVPPDLRANAPPVASPFGSPSQPMLAPPVVAPKPEAPAVARRFPPLRALTLTGINASGASALPLALMLRTVGITLVIVALPVARVGRGEALALALLGLAFVAASFAQRSAR